MLNSQKKSFSIFFFKEMNTLEVEEIRDSEIVGRARGRNGGWKYFLLMLSH